MTDPHGNVVQLTDESGAVIKTYEYHSFGNEENPDSKDDNPFRYCGEYYDKETGEIYLRARYYQPEKGRFLTRDTYTGEDDDPLSLHLYTYCYNNPICYVDNGGNCPIADWAKSLWNWITGNSKSRKSNKTKATSKPKVLPTATPQATNKSKAKKISKVYSVPASDSGKHAVTFKKKYQMSNAEYIRDFLLKKKWTLNAICGLLGNLWQECRMNPGQWEEWEETSLGYVLLQWTPATNYLNYANYSVDKVNKLADKEPKKLMDSQLNYFLKSAKKGSWIVTSGYYNRYRMTFKKYKKSKKKPYDLAFVFHASYERSGDNLGLIKGRANHAEDYYKK